MSFFNFLKSETEIFLDAVETEIRNYLLEHGVENKQIKIVRRKGELFLVLPRERTFFFVQAAINKIDKEIVSSYGSLKMKANPFEALSKNYDHNELKEGLESCLTYYKKSDNQLHLQFKLAENKIDKLLKIISDTKRQKTNTIYQKAGCN